MSFSVVIVGIGNRGRMWAETCTHSGAAQVVAAVDPSDTARADFAQRWPEIPLFPDMTMALNATRCDAVILVTPPDLHLAQAREIFGRGLPILAEKPLTLDLAEATEIVALGERSGLALSISVNFRFLPVTAAYKALVAGKTMGEPGFGHFSYIRNRDGWEPRLNKYPLTMWHPMMLEQSIHHLDLMRHVYAREVETITCRTWNPGWSMYAHDSNVHALLRFVGGMEANYFGTWTSGWNQAEFRWRTDCSAGVIIQKELYSDLFTARMADTELTPVALPPARAFIDDSEALLRDFIRAVKGGGAVPCDGADHLRTLALCFAGIESAATGQAVDVATFQARHGIA